MFTRNYDDLLNMNGKKDEKKKMRFPLSRELCTEYMIADFSLVQWCKKKAKFHVISREEQVLRTKKKPNT